MTTAMASAQAAGLTIGKLNIPKRLISGHLGVPIHESLSNILDREPRASLLYDLAEGYAERWNYLVDSDKSGASYDRAVDSLVHDYTTALLDYYLADSESEFYFG